MLLNVALTLLTAVAMEGVAWATHKYAMHGFLWSWHEDHHHPKGRGWQKNDRFAVFFSLVSFGLIVVGLMGHWAPAMSVGVGMAVYGTGYLLFHDIMFHKRVSWLHIRPRGRYLRRIVRAHAIHHKLSNGRGIGVAFGFLYASRQYDAA
jgi:beta-carotene 3-hydroxylase